MEHEQSLRDIVREFSAWTSTHGIPHIVLTENTILRSIWAILTVGAFGAAIYQVVTLFIRYFSYSVIIQPNSEYMPIPFPTVTICNINAWKRSAAAQTPLEALISAYESTAPDGPFALNGSFFERQLRARDWMLFMSERLIEMDRSVDDDSSTTNTSRHLGYTWDELFISCLYNEAVCTSRNFTSLYDAYYGRCYQFNVDGLLNGTRAGPPRGLRVVLRTNQSEYLPWVLSSGAIVVMSTFGRPPFPDAFGYPASVGESTAFGLSYLRRTKLDHPFSNCTFTSDNLPQRIYYDNIYTVESCIRSCLQDRIIAECSCYLPKFNVAFNNTAPSCFDVPEQMEALTCSNSILNFVHSSDWNVFYGCQCPFACDQSFYSATSSSTKWPAKNYISPECIVAKKVSENELTRCKEFYRDNTLVVTVYFESIEVQIQEEDQGYKIINFIADAGGATGLWLGMSIVSVIEAILFLFVVIRFLIFRPKAVKIDPAYDYFATFNNDVDIYRTDNEPALPPAIENPR